MESKTRSVLSGVCHCPYAPPMRRLSVLAVALVLGCPSSDSDPSGDTDTDTAAGTDTTDTATTMPGSSGTTDDPTTTTDPGTSTTDDPTTGTTAVDGSGSEDSSSSGVGACQVWQITYGLTGSTFEISNTPFGAGDQVNTVQEPYDANANIGPGQFILTFEDVDGAPGGLATMVEYTMDVNFVVDGVTTVTTDITGIAGPDDCGVTQGLVNDTTVAWAPPQIAGYTTEGTVLCEGNLCTAGGLPDGEPVEMGGVADQPVGNFVFEADFSGFAMDSIITDMDDQSTQTWTYVGTESSRELVDAPACACG